MVLERSQFLDSNVESAKMMTVLASLLAESGALKRADTLLRQALELFWRELKDPTAAVARCYRVSMWCREAGAVTCSARISTCIPGNPIIWNTGLELSVPVKIVMMVQKSQGKPSSLQGLCVL